MRNLKARLVVVLAVVSLFGTAQAAAPANDNCANAQSVGEVEGLSFDTTEAGFDGRGSCLRSPNVWYCYTASCTGDVLITLAGSSYDTKLAVYDGCQCNPSSLNLLGCNDDSGLGTTSEVTIAAVAGHQYLIEIGGFDGFVYPETGQGVLSIRCAGGPGPIANDNCVNATAIGNVTSMSFNATSATFDGPGLCTSNPNLWYCYTASCTGEATVTISETTNSARVAAYDGCACYPTSDKLLACTQSESSFAVIAGNQYLIEVSGKGLLTVACTPGTTPTSNNDCVNAQSIGNVTALPFSTTTATFDGPGVCIIGPNIWYCYSAPCTGNVTVQLSNATYDTMLAVYTGCACYPGTSRLIQCNDDFGGSTNSQITFAAVAGNQYLIEIGGYTYDTGQGLLTVSCEGPATPNKTDLGDAPDSTNNAGVSMTAYPAGVQANYPTVYQSGTGLGPYGPVHLNALLVAQLGKKITREIEADSGIDEDGVNNIRPSTNQADRDQGDDAVILPVNMPSCRWTTFDYTVNVINPDVDLYVNVWCDWNRDGDWDDTLQCAAGAAPEWAVQNQLLFKLPAGLNQITTPAFLPFHPAGGPQQIWMRITLSERPFKGGSAPAGKKGGGGSGPLGKYLYGETEDYYFVPDVSFNVCEDFNGDGLINTQDLVDLTAAWLASCPQ